MPKEEAPSKSAWCLEGLGAEAPDPELAGKLAAWARFVGDWVIEDCRYRTSEGQWGHLTGELHWRWILRGRALQDVWTLRDPATGQLVYEGTTLRFYDRRHENWSSNWLTATQGRLRRFVGHEEGERIVLEELVEPGATVERWVFTEVRPDSFRWYSEEDRHDGQGWTRTEEMRIRRREPTSVSP